MGTEDRQNAAWGGFGDEVGRFFLTTKGPLGRMNMSSELNLVFFISYTSLDDVGDVEEEFVETELFDVDLVATTLAKRPIYGLVGESVFGEVLAVDQDEIWTAFYCLSDAHEFPHTLLPRVVVTSHDNVLLGDPDGLFTQRLILDDVHLCVKVVHIQRNHHALCRDRNCTLRGEAMETQG